MKKILLIILSILFCVFMVYKLNKDYLLLWNSNTISIIVDSPLDSTKVVLGMDAHSPDQLTEKDIIYKQGKKVNEIGNYYGENDFIVLYDNSYYFTFRQFKTNRRHQHNYVFHLYKKNEALYVKVIIKGKNEVDLDEKMKKINPM